MINRAFILQYVAIFMILVAFMVGSYAQRHQPEGAAAPQEAVQPVAEPAQELPRFSAPGVLHLVSELKIRELFSAAPRRAEQLDPERLAPLAELLKAHDLKATVQVFAPTSAELDGRAFEENRSREGDFDRALARGQQIAAHLLAAGVPSNAFEVQLTPARNPLQVNVTFSEMELGND